MSEKYSIESIINKFSLDLFTKSCLDNNILYFVELQTKALMKIDLCMQKCFVEIFLPDDFEWFKPQLCTMRCIGGMLYIVSPYMDYFICYNISEKKINKQYLRLICKDIICSTKGYSGKYVSSSSFLSCNNMLVLLPFKGDYILKYEIDEDRYTVYTEWKKTIQYHMQKDNIDFMHIRIKSACIVDSRIYFVAATSEEDVICSLFTDTMQVERIYRANKGMLWWMCADEKDKRIHLFYRENDVLSLVTFDICNHKMEFFKNVSNCVDYGNSKAKIITLGNNVLLMPNESGKGVVLDKFSGQISDTFCIYDNNIIEQLDSQLLLYYESKGQKISIYRVDNNEEKNSNIISEFAIDFSDIADYRAEFDLRFDTTLCKDTEKIEGTVYESADLQFGDMLEWLKNERDNEAEFALQKTGCIYEKTKNDTIGKSILDAVTNM
ncbi:MAG: hypothetical protein HFH14_04530 [Lachnospiraceae bacterium]|nr:hypothetical protein [Lachnospiraceae bacterium]